jgi:hypothetical protein
VSPQHTERQSADDGRVAAVQEVPLVENAAAVDGPLATATKRPLPNATACQVAVVGSVRAVQVTPSAVLAATVPLVAETATNKPIDSPQAIPDQLETDGIAPPAVQVIPSGEVFVVVAPLEIAIARIAFDATADQVTVAVSVLAEKVTPSIEEFAAVPPEATPIKAVPLSRSTLVLSLAVSAAISYPDTNTW